MAAPPRPGSRVHRWLAGVLSGLALAGLGTAVGGALAGGASLHQATATFTVTDGAMGLTFTVCGLLLAWHRPRNAIGWMFLAAGLGTATSAGAAQLLELGARSGWSTGSLRLTGTVFVFAWPLAVGLFIPVALLLFPDGRPAGPRWRWLVRAAAVEGVLFTATFASPAPEVIDHRTLTLDLVIPAYHRLGALWAVGDIAWAGIIVGAMASLAVRYRRGSDAERRQLLWLLLAVLVVLAYVGVVWGVFSSGPILGLLVIGLIPAAVTIAVLRHQLLDIRLVVSRALVYGLLTAAAAAVYIGLIAVLDSLVRRRVSLDSAVVASIVVAVGFNPARVRLQRLIERGLYGDRRDPVRAVSRIGQRLAGPGVAGLAGVLEALCDSLRLPFAAVRFGAAEVAAHGTAPELLHGIGLRYEGEQVGELVIGLRSGQRRLGSADLLVLDLLADPLAVALQATALSAALQESRVGIVAAREEERRRLRRDLHDGLGPALTGIAFKTDAASNSLPPGAARAGELLSEIRAETTAAISDIRRLVYGLRPPALDDLGLIGSLRELSARLAARPGGAVVAVRIDAPVHLPPLPAAVEVAAYRIVAEALTNAARHSGASQVGVCLTLAAGDVLRIDISDDGAQPQAPWPPGLGLVSMSERAAELGGSCRAGPDPRGGGRVTAALPLGAAPAGGSTR